jgi:hypothetical protein
VAPGKPPSACDRARCYLQRPALRECPDFKTRHLNDDSRKLSWEIARPGWTTTVYTAGIRCAPGSSLLEFEATTAARNRKPAEHNTSESLEKAGKTTNRWRANTLLLQNNPL